MNDYIETRIDILPCNEDMTDFAAAVLADCGYESFVSDTTGLTAYCPASVFPGEGEVTCALEDFPWPDTRISIKHTRIEGKDWNKEWEQNYFKPIVIDNRVVIHSTFHDNVPEAQYRIVIDPRMAFGTGHHHTTRLMVRALLSLQDFIPGKTVTDMGTGTGILAMLSCLLGAKEVTGIEIDPFAQENAVENLALNGLENRAHILLGDATRLSQTPQAHIFLANINRNVILNDIDSYRKHIAPGGYLILSGFYQGRDAQMLTHAAEKLGFDLVNQTCSGDTTTQQEENSITPPCNQSSTWTCLTLKLK